MSTRPHSAPRSMVAALFALSGLPLGLTGCAVSRTTPTPIAAQTIHLQGRVFGGQQPVSGSIIQLWAAGNTGLASSSAPLLTSPVTTDASGSFSITGDYTCPSSASPVYLTATHGNPGLNNNAADNAALALVTVLGPCGSLSGSTSITINEVTTVAAAVALAPFASAINAVGSTASNSAGLTTAMSTAMTLADSATGLSPAATLPANATIESAKVYTLANLLAACVNSDGTGLCPTIFQDAVGTSSSAAPADTFQLALQIAQHPTLNVQQLFNDIPAQTAFGAGLPQAPTDWTVSIAYTGGGMNQPAALALDAAGNVWVTSIGNVLSEFSPQGASLQGSGITGYGLQSSVAIAIDSSSNLLVGNMQSVINNGHGTVSRFTGAGSALSGHNGISSGNIDYPVAFASDPGGQTWIANAGSSTLTLLAADGSIMSGVNGYGAGALSSPSALLVNPDHSVWVASRSSGVLAQFDSTGNLLQQAALPGVLPDSLAADSAGRLWIADNANSTLSVIQSDGSVLAVGQTAAGLDRPHSLTIDAGDRLFATNNVQNTLTMLAASNGPGAGSTINASPALGAGAAMHQPFAAAVDQAGTLWVTSLGDNRLIAFPGLATPTKTPVAGQAVAP